MGLHDPAEPTAGGSGAPAPTETATNKPATADPVIVEIVTGETVPGEVKADAAKPTVWIEWYEVSLSWFRQHRDSLGKVTPAPPVPTNGGIVQVQAQSAVAPNKGG